MGMHANDAVGTLVWTKPPRRPTRKKCRLCGQEGLLWGQLDSGKWWLFERGKPHRCKDRHGKAEG